MDRSVIALSWTQPVIHVRRVSYGIGCKRKCLFVNPGILVRHELGTTKWSKCQYDTFRLIYIRVMTHLRICPKKSKLRMVFRKHAYLQVHFTDVTSDCNWETTEAKKPEKKKKNRFVGSLGPGRRMCSFKDVPWNLAVALNMILVFDVDLSGRHTRKWGIRRYQILFGFFSVFCILRMWGNDPLIIFSHRRLTR